MDSLTTIISEDGLLRLHYGLDGLINGFYELLSNLQLMGYGHLILQGLKCTLFGKCGFQARHLWITNIKIVTQWKQEINYD
jgi:hypothetical protein